MSYNGCMIGKQIDRDSRYDSLSPDTFDASSKDFCIDILVLPLVITIFAS